MIDVQNILNHPNQFEIFTGGKRVFKSYNSICAVVENEIITLGKDWNYSKTTLKHLKEFLNTTESKKEIQTKIDKGVYLYDNELR